MISSKKLTSFHQYFYKNPHALTSPLKHEDQLPDQKAVAKYETNAAELITIPKNVINVDSGSNSLPMIENIQHTHEALPSIS